MGSKANSYHNTTPLYGEDLVHAVLAAKTQDEAVLVVMYGGGAWTPSQLLKYFVARGKKWPITSVRRALSNLTRAGRLKMTGKTAIGPMGKPENIWIIDTSHADHKELFK